VARVPIEYNHPKSINQNSIPQYRNTCQNHVKVKIAIIMKINPVNEPSFGYGRDFLISKKVAPQTSIPIFRNAKKIAVIQI
jgi:hypothetical protein